MVESEPSSNVYGYNWLRQVCIFVPELGQNKNYSERSEVLIQ